MATANDDVKRDITSSDNQKIEDLAEKTSNSSGEVEAQHVELDDKEAARVLRKVDYRLVPMLSLLYLVAFIDRSNMYLSRLFQFVRTLLTNPKAVMRRLLA